MILKHDGDREPDDDKIMHNSRDTETPLYRHAYTYDTKAKTFAQTRQAKYHVLKPPPEESPDPLPQISWHSRKLNTSISV